MQYSEGDFVNYLGKRLVCVAAHLSTYPLVESNWFFHSSLDNQWNFFTFERWEPPEHIRMGAASLSTSTVSQNSSPGHRFGFARKCVLKGVRFETTTTTTTSSCEIQVKVYNSLNGQLGNTTVLGTLPASTFSTTGIKTLSDIDYTIDAGIELIISICARGGASPTMRATATLDPTVLERGVGGTTVMAISGFTGTNQVTTVSSSAIPIIEILTGPPAESI